LDKPQIFRGFTPIIGNNPRFPSAPLYGKIGYTIAVVGGWLGGALPRTPASSKEQNTMQNFRMDLLANL
jgi:hypothetical protein